MFRKLCFLLLLLAAPGCIAIGGGDDYEQAVVYPTRFEEDEALERAKRKGIIDDAELQTAKAMLDRERPNFHRVYPKHD